MATALHPHFKLGVVQWLASSAARRVFREVTNIVSDEKVIEDTEVRQEADDDPFMYMNI